MILYHSTHRKPTLTSIPQASMETYNWDFTYGLRGFPSNNHECKQKHSIILGTVYRDITCNNYLYDTVPQYSQETHTHKHSIGFNGNIQLGFYLWPSWLSQLPENIQLSPFQNFQLIDLNLDIFNSIWVNYLR